MASFRQRLINASSFLSDQKEKIGGLNVKKSTISGDAFKKGTPLEKRVGVNEKKITLLKNIGSLRKDNQKKQFNSPLLESLQSIASTVDSIRDTLIQQQDNDKGIAEDMRREKEEKERQDQEKGLETKPKLLQKLVDPVIKPVMSLWSKILNFITTIFLGKILMNFLDWFGNPENQGKITTLVRFVKDWWPALVGAVLLFGTGFGGLVTGLTVAIATFIPKMLAAITALKASKLGALGGKAGLLKGGLLVGGGVLAGMGISKMMDKGDGEDVSNEKVQGLNKGGKVRGQGNKDTVPAMLTPGEFVMSKGAVEQYGVDTMESMNAAAGGTNRPTLGRYKEGGVVTDPKEKARIEAETLYWVNKERTEFLGLPPLDKITYAAGVELTKAMGPEYYGKGIKETSNTDMNFDTMTKSTWKTKSRGAETIFQGSVGQLTEEDKQAYLDSNPQARLVQALHQQIEMDKLGADISASAKMNGGGLVQGFQGGGLVTVKPGTINSYQDAIDAGIQVEDIVTGSGRFGSIKWKEKIPRGLTGGLFGKQKYQVKGTKWNLSGAGGAIDKELAMSTEDYVNMKMGWSGASSAKAQNTSISSGLGVGKVENMVNMDGYKKPDIQPSTANKSGSSGILGPISSNIDAMVNTDKYEVKPKENKNVVIAYEQEAGKGKQQQDAPPPGGNDIPSFDVRPPFMTDQDKLMVLGMRV